MKKNLTRLLSAVLLIATILVAWNYFSVWRPVSQALGKKPMNQTVKVGVYHQYLTNPSVLVFDLRGISGNATQNEVLSVLLQSAEVLKDKTFQKVVLAYKGKPKFQLEGTYFQKLGEEYPWQNPNYTMFTFAENVRTLQDEAAFGEWASGGRFDVMNNQLKDLNSFHREWYVEDWSKSM